MSGTDFGRAHREYQSRPADERFADLQALVTAATDDKRLSVERSYNLRDLSAVLNTAADGPSQTILLQSPKGAAEMTHWAFGQLSRTIGAPAGYLRTLPPAVATGCINHGLHSAAAVGSTANLLVRAANGHPQPIIRACTSESYGRLWDADLYAALDANLSHDGKWIAPPTWSGEAAGTYRGDRDSFVIRVNGGSIVNDPSAGGRGEMFKGLLIRNSEVGACSVTVDAILFRQICGNHMLWGAISDRRFKRRHVGARVLRDTVRELSRMAWSWTTASVERDQRIIAYLIDHELAATREAVIDELRAVGATKEQAELAYSTCEQKEAASPRSYWGLAQGLTRASQETTYQDERYQLDKVAADLMAKGARELVTV